MVIGAGYHLGTTVKFFLGRLRCGGYGPPPFPGFCRCICDLVQGALNKWVLALKRDAVAHGQVCRTDEQKVDTLYGCNLIYAVDRLPVFNLDDQENFFIASAYVFNRVGKAMIGVGTSVVETAFALRRESRPFRPFARFVRTAAMRNHDPICAKFQRSNGTGITILADANHQIYTCGPAC